MHLNIRLMILIESSDEGPCQVYRSRLVFWAGELLKIDQITGVVTRVTGISKLLNGVSGSSGLTPVIPLEFRNMILGNEASAAEVLDKMFEAARTHHSIISRPTWSHDGEGDTNVSPHEMPTITGYLFGWFLDPPAWLISTIVYGVALTWAFWIFKTFAWPFIATKLLKKAHLLVTKESKALHDEIKLLREELKSKEESNQVPPPPPLPDKALQGVQDELSRMAAVMQGLVEENEG
jgi:hypothetical protein